MEAWRCAAFLAVLAESLSVDEERGLMDHRRVRTSRLPPLSRREKPCLRAGGCWGGFAGGELFRVGRYVSTGAREVVRDFERKMRHCVRRREKSFSSFLFRFRGNCGKVSPGGCGRQDRERLYALNGRETSHSREQHRDPPRLRSQHQARAGHVAPGQDDRGGVGARENRERHNACNWREAYIDWREHEEHRGGSN